MFDNIFINSLAGNIANIEKQQFMLGMHSSSPVTFLMGDYVMEIGFDQISPSTSLQEIWEQNYFVITL